MSASPTPDQSMITAFLHTATHRWSELNEPSVLEIRALTDGKAADYRHFKPQEIEAAAIHSTELNAAGWNHYACVNTVAKGTVGAATDDDILAAFYCFADADDEYGANSIADAPLQPSMLVTTGTMPWRRLHGYWELDEPCRDMGAWRGIQKNIASKLGTDSCVTNPSRIMRLAGTVSYPSNSKKQRGYVPERTTFEMTGAQ